MDKISKNRNFLLFLILCAFSIGLGSLIKYLVLDDKMYYSYLSEQMAYERMVDYLESQEKWQWVNYVFVPIIYFLKLNLISLSLLIGIVFLGIKTSFKQLFRVALLAEFVMMIPILVKILWFIFIDTEYTFEEVNYFMPLSLSNLFEAGELAIYWAYPLQIANVFELIYWFVLAYLIGKLLHSNTAEGFKVVLYGYFPSLLLWVLLFIFLYVNIG
jgi:hypothetical protein